MSRNSSGVETLYGRLPTSRSFGARAAQRPEIELERVGQVHPQLARGPRSAVSSAGITSGSISMTSSAPAPLEQRRA